jgi:hypothetical protein
VAGIDLGASTGKLLIQWGVTAFDAAEHDSSAAVETVTQNPCQEVLLAYRSGWSQPGCRAWIC